VIPFEFVTVSDLQPNKKTEINDKQQARIILFECILFSFLSSFKYICKYLFLLAKKQGRERNFEIAGTKKTRMFETSGFYEQSYVLIKLIS
jgi:hypothetical protein